MHRLGCVFCLVFDMVFMRQIVQGLRCVFCLVLDMFSTRQIVHGLGFVFCYVFDIFHEAARARAWLCILSCF